MPDTGGRLARTLCILLLEDSEIDAELLAAHLTKADLRFELHRAVNRREFVDLLEEGHCEVILADYSLPDFDGLSALNISRALQPDIPFIFVSGVVGEEFATNALKRGATDYVMKRNLTRLATAVERALEQAHERRERQGAEEALRRLTVDLEDEVRRRTAERDRIWTLGRDLFAVLTFEGELRRVNPAWETLLGYNTTKLVGARLDTLVVEEDRPVISEMARRLAAGEIVERFETRVMGADGGWRWISWTGAADDLAYAIGRDVTAEKAISADLEERNRELAAQIEERERVEATLRQMQRLEAVGQLTSGVAHDFNNLLTVILGNIGFVEKALAKQGVNGAIAERINHMRTAAERGARLTGQMLAFSRRQKLTPKPVDLNETVAGMRDLLQSTMGGSVRIETVLKPRLWPALVDPTQIELIILNLAINARDAMEVGGGLTVETATVTLREPPARPEEPLPGDYVMLSVSDTGSGMSDEVLAKAFEPFFTTKEVGKGSGLGLAQVFGFAKQSGGGVRIETRLGEGTAVKVYLPRAASPARREAEPARRTSPVTTSARTLLVMDDDSAVREITAAMLEELGYAVVEAGSGGAALDVLRGDASIDLLLADYAMPGMNGVEAARAAAELRPGLPVLFITGFADLKALRDVGEDRIIQKPFRDDELARKVEAVLGGARSGKVVSLRR
jgi:PAS domain S-box-containing protein